MKGYTVSAFLKDLKSKRIEPWVVLLSSLIGFCAAGYLLRTSGTALTVFKDRAIGIAILNGIDPTLRSAIYFKIIFLFIIIYFICVLLFSFLHFMLERRSILHLLYVKTRSLLIQFLIVSNLAVIIFTLHSLDSNAESYDTLLGILYFYIAATAIFILIKTALFFGGKFFLKYFIPILVFSILSVPIYWFFFNKSYILRVPIRSLTIEVKSPPYDDTYQVFYDRGSGYIEADSVKFNIKGRGEGVEELYLKLPKNTKGIRIDSGKDGIIIKSISMATMLNRFKWPPEEIIRDFHHLHDDNFLVKDNLLYAHSSIGLSMNESRLYSLLNLLYNAVVFIFILSGTITVVSEWLPKRLKSAVITICYSPLRFFSFLNTALMRYISPSSVRVEKSVLFILCQFSIIITSIYLLSKQDLYIDILKILCFFIILTFAIAAVKTLFNKLTGVKLFFHYHIIIPALFFPPVIFFIYWVISDGTFTFGPVYFIWYLILFFLFFSVYSAIKKFLKNNPKSDLGFWVKSQSRLKDKARGNFATQPYITNTVRSKIDDNAVFQDESAIFNSAKAEFGNRLLIDKSLIFSFIPFILIPLSIPISNELQFALSGAWDIAPGALSFLIILLLLISSLFIFFMPFKIKAVLKPSNLINNIYFPVLIATVYLYKFHVHSLNLGADFDFLHLGQMVFPSQQLFHFGKIPYIDVWPGRGLTETILPVLYTSINGYRGFEMILWGWVVPVFGGVLVYLLLSRFAAPLFSLLFVTLLPIEAIDLGGTVFVIYFIASLIPALCIYWTFKRPTFFRFTVFWASVLFVGLWMPTLASGAVLGAIAVLIGYHLLNRWAYLKSSFLSFLFVNGSALVFYIVLILFKNKSIADHFILIKSMATTNGLIGSYPAFINEISLIAIFQYLILPSVSVLYIMLFITRVFKREKLQLSGYIFVFLSIFSLLYFQRTFERHCLLEVGYNPYFFVFLGLSFPFFFKLNRVYSQTIFILFFLLCFLIYSAYFPAIKGFNYIKDGRLFEFRYWKNKERRVVSDDTYHRELLLFLNRHLTSEQTFFEFTNAPLLYFLTEREFPFLYHAAQIYFSEPPQIVYIKNMENLYKENKIPFVIFKNIGWWGNGIDGIPTEASAYLIAEFIYKNYKPLTYINTYQIWIANNFRLKPPPIEDDEKVYAKLSLKNEVALSSAKRIDNEKIIVTCGEWDPYLYNFINLENLGPLDMGKKQFLKLSYKTSAAGILTVGFMFNGAAQENASLSVVEVEKSASDEFKEVLIPINILHQDKRILTDIRFDPPENSIFEVHGVELVEKGDYMVPLNYIQQDFNLIKLPYIWGTYDSKQASSKTDVLSALVDSKRVITPENPLELYFNPDIDKSSGNYLHLRLKSKSKADITISYGKLVNSIKFEALPSDKFEDYLIRISSQWEWMSEAVNFLSIKSSAPVEIEKMLIRKGD